MQIEALKQVGPDIVHTHPPYTPPHTSPSSLWRVGPPPVCHCLSHNGQWRRKKSHYPAIFTRRTHRRVSGLDAKLRFSQSIKSDRGVNTIKVSTHQQKNIRSLEEAKKLWEKEKKKLWKKSCCTVFFGDFFLFLYSQASTLIQHFSRFAFDHSVLWYRHRVVKLVEFKHHRARLDRSP